MNLFWDVVHLAVAVSAVVWVILALINRRAGEPGAMIDDPNVSPPDVDTRPPDPGTGSYSDYTTSLPVKPLPPTDGTR